MLFRDSRKRIWIGGEKGLSVYNQVGMALQANTDFRITPVLQQSFVNCIYESLSGSIWVGTRDGLFALKEADKELQQYTTDDGLPSNVIYGILEDSYGRLWVSTNQGLSCFDPENRTGCRAISLMPVLIAASAMAICCSAALTASPCSVPKP